MDRDREIIEAIGGLKEDIATLKQKYEGLSSYMFHDLKPDIDKLCNKIESCMTKADESYHKTFKWMVATMFTLIIAVIGWMGLVIRW